jgi:hypothetical protein
VRAHIIANPVPTPEELGKILRASPERVAAVRQIMDGPAKEKVKSHQWPPPGSHIREQTIPHTTLNQ